MTFRSASKLVPLMTTTATSFGAEVVPHFNLLELGLVCLKVTPEGY